MKKLKSLFNLFITLFKIGLFTFGGGYAMIAVLQRELVERKKWIEQDEFLDLMMMALQPFSKDYGTLPNIWVRTGYKLRTDKYNGRKCYVLEIDSKSSYREIWIDKEKNTLIRTVEEIYNRSYREKVYSIKSDVVTNEDVTLPDITDYTIKNTEKSIPNEYIETYEQLGI